VRLPAPRNVEKKSFFDSKEGAAGVGGPHQGRQGERGGAEGDWAGRLGVRGAAASWSANRKRAEMDGQWTNSTRKGGGSWGTF